MKATAAPEKVDEDWMTQFMDKARLVSDEEIRHIWAKILADECNEPDSVPKGLLFTLEKMGREDAETFVNTCRISVRIDRNFFPIVIPEKYEAGAYDIYGIDYEKLLQLDKLGLIENSIDKLNVFFASRQDLFENTIARAEYHNNSFIFPEGVREIPVGKVLFTKDGQALCKAIDCEEAPAFWEEIARPWFEGLEFV